MCHLFRFSSKYDGDVGVVIDFARLVMVSPCRSGPISHLVPHHRLSVASLQMAIILTLGLLNTTKYSNGHYNLCLCLLPIELPIRCELF